MDFRRLLFLLHIISTEKYFSNGLKKELVLDNRRNSTSNLGQLVSEEIQDSIDNLVGSKNSGFEAVKKSEGVFISFEADTKKNLSNIKNNLKNLYENFIGYAKSSYASIKKSKKREDPDCWQIGIDISKTCNFIFFPKKMKKITGILIDKGIMLDYINPSPVLCYF